MKRSVLFIGVLFAGCATAKEPKEKPKQKQESKVSADAECRPKKYGEVPYCGKNPYGGPQAEYLEGEGLELTHFRSDSFPPAQGTKVTRVDGCSNGQTPDAFTIGPCTQVSKGRSQCQATSNTDTEIVCGKSGQAVGVSLVKGYWDKKGAFVQGDGKDFTMSCDAMAYEEGSSVFHDGAISRCAGYFRYEPEGDQKRLLSCIRMFRSDYCGDGVSRTAPGTFIDVHDDAGLNAPRCDKDACFEASWSPDGAECVGHLRWEFGGGLNNICGKAFSKDSGGGVKCRATQRTAYVFDRTPSRNNATCTPVACSNGDPTKACATP